LFLIIVAILEHLYLWKFKLRGTTNKTIWRNHKRRQELPLDPSTIYGRNAISNKYIHVFFERWV